MVKFECGSCGFKKAVDDKYAGKNVRCPKCTAPVLVSNQQIIQAEKSYLIKIYCPLCNKKVAVPPEYAGKRVRCPNCKNAIEVPAAQAVAEPAMVQQQSFDDVQGLAAMEQQAQSLDLPREVMPPPISSQTSPSAPRVQKPSFSGFQGGMMLTIISFIIGIIVWVAMYMYISAAIKEIKPLASELSIQQTNEANDFAINCLTKLYSKDVNSVYSLLATELQNKENRELLETFADSNTSFPKNNYKVGNAHGVKRPEGNFYVFTYQLDNNNSSVVMSVRETEGKKIIEGIMKSYNFITNPENRNKQPIFMQSDYCMKTFVDVTKDFGFPVLKLVGKIFFILFIFGIIMLISGWIVFGKAGEPAWAVLIPIYNLWVLAKVADKPGYYGLAIFGLLLVPKIGGFASGVMTAIISFGVSAKFNRGKLFGVGLFFFPYVFYPVLAFTKDE